MKLFFTPRLQKDRRSAFTLTEALFTIGILGIIFAAMIPFIRTVHTSWNIGDRKTEIQQNARVGIETMLRSIREAKRIINMPESGRGKFIELKDSQDTQTTIFFHNVKSSSYYIGNTGLINEDDLVMSTIDDRGRKTDMLLAKSLKDFRIDFKNNDGQVATNPFRVYYVDIYMELTDSQGLLSDTMDVFSSVTLRAETKITKPVWAGAASNLTELLTEIELSGFNKPYSISIDPSDGSIWVADTYNNRIKKLSSEGKLLLDFSSNRPVSVCVDIKTGECWVADTFANTIRKFSSSGATLVFEQGFNRPLSVSADSSTQECWVADSSNNRVVKLSSTGGILFSRSGFKLPKSLSANSSDGSCWVADTLNNRVIKLSSSGSPLQSISGFKRPGSVSVNINDGSCWVADTSNNRIVKISSEGKILFSTSGFKSPSCVSVDSSEGSCWISDTGNGEVVKLDSEGNEEFRIAGFTNTLAVASSQ